MCPRLWLLLFILFLSTPRQHVRGRTFGRRGVYHHIFAIVLTSIFPIQVQHQQQEPEQDQDPGEDQLQGQHQQQEQEEENKSPSQEPLYP